jgi:hypothetical protein
VAQYESSMRELVRDLRPDSERFAVEATKLADAGLARIEEWCQPAQLALDTQIESAVKDLEGRLTGVGPEPSGHELRLLAERLADFDSVERTALYAGADAATKRRMELASQTAAAMPVRRSDGSLAWETLLDADTVSRHRAARLRDLDPEATQAIRRLERVRSLYVGFASSARALIRGPKR